MNGILVLLLLGLTGALTAAHAAGCADDRGSRLFSRCAVCHSLKPAENGVGPSLANLRGRKAGTLPGFAFSAALTQSGWVWDEATLDRFLREPQAALPGTVMPFGGLRNEAERAALVCFLLQEM